jgi:HlyD family secretion protein
MKPAPRQDPRRRIRQLTLTGIGLIALMVGGAGGWAATSELSGAVVASGSLVVESSVKRVQHATGGIVGKLLVDEGSSVEAGQVMIRLDDTTPRTTLGIVRSGLDAQLLRQARLAAERDGKDSVAWPDELVARREESALASAFAGEEKLFEARRAMLIGQRAQLKEQITQLNEEIRGLTAQQEAKENELALTAKDLDGIAELYAKKLVSVDRQSKLESQKAQLEGERGQLIAEIAGARGKISETELQVLQLDRDFQTDVLDNLRESDAAISELRERLVSAEDQLRRIDIRAPQAGIVHELTVHAPGAVIEPGETIMSIVPRADLLVVDMKVQPRDIDQIDVGSKTAIRILAANQRTTPTLDATITRISAELSQDPESKLPYYLVRAELGAETALPAGLRLRSGMPVEAYIATEERTPLEYLLKPLDEQIARAFRER